MLFDLVYMYIYVSHMQQHFLRNKTWLNDAKKGYSYSRLCSYVLKTIRIVTIIDLLSNFFSKICYFSVRYYSIWISKIEIFSKYFLYFLIHPKKNKIWLLFVTIICRYIRIYINYMYTDCILLCIIYL